MGKIFYNEIDRGELIVAISFGKSLKNERAAMMRSNTSKPVQVETSAISTYAADDNYTRSEKYNGTISIATTIIPV